MIKRFEKSYAVRDKQDVLAMCALQFATQVEQRKIDTIEDKQHIEEKLKAMNQLLQEQLS